MYTYTITFTQKANVHYSERLFTTCIIQSLQWLQIKVLWSANFTSNPTCLGARGSIHITHFSRSTLACCIRLGKQHITIWRLLDFHTVYMCVQHNNVKRIYFVQVEVIIGGKTKYWLLKYLILNWKKHRLVSSLWLKLSALKNLTC